TPCGCGGGRPTRHDQLRQQDLDGLAALGAGFAAHSRHPAIGPRAGRHDLLDFAYDLEDIARPRRLRPTDLAAGADDPAHEWQSRLDQQAHGDRRRMPAASVPVPTFVSLCSTRAYERRNQRDTSNYVIPVWLRI